MKCLDTCACSWFSFSRSKASSYSSLARASAALVNILTVSFLISASLMVGLNLTCTRHFCKSKFNTVHYHTHDKNIQKIILEISVYLSWHYSSNRRRDGHWCTFGYHKLKRCRSNWCCITCNTNCIERILDSLTNCFVTANYIKDGWISFPGFVHLHYKRASRNVILDLPLPILGTGWVNSFILVCELTTCKAAVETSFRVVEAKCITCLDNSRGG